MTRRFEPIGLRAQVELPPGRLLGLAIVVIGSLAAGLLPMGVAQGQVPTYLGRSGVHVFSRGYAKPIALVLRGPDLFVADYAS